MSAAHDSVDRGGVDAPKCHPETRKAVQEEIMGWIEHGDGKKILWLAGPAGSGKTAIAGTIAEECQKKGWLAGSFFFSAFSTIPGRRSSEFLIATLAYQLTEHKALAGLKDEILQSIGNSPAIFKKNLKEQLDNLIVLPLCRISCDRAAWPRVIIIDALDEIVTDKKLLPGQKDHVGRTHAMTATTDLLEQANPVYDYQQDRAVLSAISHAAKTDSFPFRIIVVSRPERDIREFFSGESNLSKEVFLDNKYNPDADIALFLKAKLGEIGRRYELDQDWVSQGDVDFLVEAASGQFIYAATVIRFVGSTNSERPPLEQLKSILQWRRETPTKARPFARLDILYTGIINTSPNPALAAQWIATMQYLNASLGDDAQKGLYIRSLLESSPGQMQWLLGGLASLLQIPSGSGQLSLLFYHKSLLDFVGTPSRSQPAGLHVDKVIVEGFLKDRYHKVLKSAPFMFTASP